MAKTISISDVFKSTGQPTVTYVERDQGKYEHVLSAGIDGRGQLCLVTGPSKTGKTTLYKRVLETKKLSAIVVRCDNDLTPIDFWRRALEQVNFSQFTGSESTVGTTTQVSTTLAGAIGWKWLAGLTGEISGGVSGSATETEARQRILASPSPQHLVPVLKQLPAMLVVEDFHYLAERVQRIVFQQWKSFIDNEVSVIILGTTHHAVDIAYSNPDLLGRISQIDVSRWEEKDLCEIVRKGFDYLDLAITPTVGDTIARESVGLPIIAQQSCEQLFVDKKMSKVRRGDAIQFSQNEVYDALNHVATMRYGQLESYYNTITRGPRRRARKYNTYELVLTCFAQEPIKFSLPRYEIDERLRKLPIAANEVPPPASLTSMLKALQKFQATNNIELLEWRANERILYIIEPAFLFYLRWRQKQDVGGTGEETSWVRLLDQITKIIERDKKFVITTRIGGGDETAR